MSGMEFFEQLNEAMERKPPPSRPARQMADDWMQVFFVSEAGRRVFGDMLAESGLYDTGFLRDSSNFFVQGKQYFVKGIIKTAGLDTEEGQHRLFVMKTQAERLRKEQQEANNG